MLQPSRYHPHLLGDVGWHTGEFRIGGESGKVLYGLDKRHSGFTTLGPIVVIECPIQSLEQEDGISCDSMFLSHHMAMSLSTCSSYKRVIGGRSLP